MSDIYYFEELDDQISNSTDANAMNKLAYELQQKSVKLHGARRIRFAEPEGFDLGFDLAAELDSILLDMSISCVKLAKQAADRAVIIREDIQMEIDEQKGRDELRSWYYGAVL